jgi:hypothetical protein
MTGRNIFLLAMLGLWALAVLSIGFWLNAKSAACGQSGDLAAECFAPQAQFAFGIIFILTAISGIALWWILSRRKSDKSRE